MIKQRLIFLILILQLAVLGLASCTPDEQSTPTPFPGSGTSNSTTRTSDEIIPVDLVDLAASPEIYEGAYLKVNGRYRRLPTRVCSNEPYPSPVAWSLTTGELVAHMGGLDAQLRSLIPDETTMVVSGIWRHWQGPVGCGKAATVQQFWYLEVREVISPNPLTQITLTPTHPTDGTQIASTGDGSSNDGSSNDNPSPSSTNETPNPNQEETAVSVPIDPDEPTPIPTGTPNGNGGANPPTIAPTVTAVSTEVDDGGSDDEDDNSSSTATSTPVNSGGNSSTATPANTVQPGSGGTPAPTTPSLSTSTPVPQTVEIDELESEQLGYELIDNSEIHVWLFELSANDVITVSTASQPGLNLALTLIDPTGQTVVDHQDLSPEGSVEIIKNVPIMTSGEYELHIQTTDNTLGEYVVSIYDNSDSSIPFIYKDVLAYGEDGTATLIDGADDFWHFYGNSGDNVTITMIPDDPLADMLLFLWAETGNIAESDDLDVATEMITITLPDNGMYSIEVGDGFFEEQGYTISIIKNN